MEVTKGEEEGADRGGRGGGLDYILYLRRVSRNTLV